MLYAIFKQQFLLLNLENCSYLERLHVYGLYPKVLKNLDMAETLNFYVGAFAAQEIAYVDASG